MAAGLLGFILSWNEFLYALVITGPGTNTLPVGLAGLETHAGVEIAPLAAATLLALLPVFVLLPFLRKYLIKGLSLGANAYVVKPVHFEDFRKAVASVGAFWGALNESPAIAG